MDNQLNNIDYQKLLSEGKRFLQTEYNYGKLTATEKLIVFLSTIAVVAVGVIFGILALYFVSEAVVDVLTITLGSVWAANLVVAVIILAVMAILLFMRRQLIIDPIARFVTKLLLNNKD
ncbi:MAG: phage holin family protein [Muribaculaceae bacterium]|nr:phage holin family protein [Muribaculaceae bacterium]